MPTAIVRANKARFPQVFLKFRRRRVYCELLKNSDKHGLAQTSTAAVASRGFDYSFRRVQGRFRTSKLRTVPLRTMSSSAMPLLRDCPSPRTLSASN
jgi:hypothetical protein